MRWLGIDVGEARVGIAICDHDERVAVALEVVPASAAFPALRAIAGREEAGGFVVGLPLTLSGEEGTAAAMARRLGDRLARETGLPVEYEDERLTSVAAERHPARLGDRKPSDDIAAALLLQQFIDRRRTRSERGAGRADERRPEGGDDALA